MLDANKPITVSLTAGAMNIVMQALYEVPMPYRLTNPVIENLRKQILEAEPDVFETVAATAPRVNGIDAAVQG